MKSSLKTLLAVGTLALAAGQASASVYSPGSTVDVNPGLSDAELYTSLPGASYSYDINSLGNNFVTFTLLETSIDKPKLTAHYQLTRSDNFSLSWNLTDDNVGPLESFSVLLSQGLYNLKISFDEANYRSSSTLLTSAVPLPAAAWLFGSALLGMGALRRKQSAAKEMATV